MLHSFSFVNCLIKRKAVCAHKLLAIDNMIGFVVQTVARGFTAFARAAGVVLLLT